MRGREVEDVELVARGTRGTHGESMQRSFQVHVSCSKRPTWSAQDRRARGGRYGMKRRRDVQPCGVDPFRVGDDRELRGQRSRRRDGRSASGSRTPSAACPRRADEPDGRRAGARRPPAQRRGAPAAPRTRASAPHATAPRHIRRRSAQRRNESSMPARSCVCTATGSMPSERKSRDQPRPSAPRARRGARPPRVASGTRERRARSPGRRTGSVMPPTSGKLRSQTGSCIEHGDELPAVLERALPDARGRAGRGSRRGRTRTPASAGRGGARRGTRAPGRRCRRARGTARSNSPGLGARLAARRAPVRLAVGVVEVAGEAACGDRALRRSGRAP